MSQPLKIVVLKPSKYTADGYVERFRWGFMPNSTVPYVRSMTPAVVGGTPIEVHTIDEYVHTDLGYLVPAQAGPGAAGRCWRWWACRATSSIAPWTSRPMPARTGAWRSSAGPTR